MIIRSPTGSRTIQAIELMNLLRADQVAPAAVTVLVRVFAQRERQMVTDQRTMRGQVARLTRAGRGLKQPVAAPHTARRLVARLTRAGRGLKQQRHFVKRGRLLVARLTRAGRGLKHLQKRCLLPNLDRSPGSPEPGVD